MNTILGYIQEMDTACLSILKNRKEIAKPFVDFLSNNPVDELVFLGSGTSCHAAMVAKPLIEDVCNIKIVTGFPTIFIDQTKKLNKASCVIGISQSGNSSSTKKALAFSKELGVNTMLFTSNLNSFISSSADVIINIDCGDEKAVAKTKGYQATIVTLWICALEYALKTNRIDEKVYTDYIDVLKRTILNIPVLVEQSISWYNTNEKLLSNAKSFMVVGCESQFGNVLEGALKLIETVRIPVAGYELEEFMHGIYNAINQESYLIYINHNSAYSERLLKLKKYLDQKTNYQFLIQSMSESEDDNQNCVLDFVNDKYFCGIEYIIPFQVICNYLPVLRGIDPFISGDPNFHKSLSSKVV